MRTYLIVGALTTCLVGGTAATAHAANFWGQSFFRTRLDVETCIAAAVTGIRNATGGNGAVVHLDVESATIKGFTATGSVFVDCMGSPVAACPDGRPVANASVIAFSSVSGTEAATLRDTVARQINSGGFSCTVGNGL